MRTMRQKAVFILVILTLSAVKSLAQSGKCGENATWTFDSSTKTLTISGTGDMTDYQTLEQRPWHPFASSIAAVTIEGGVTGFGNLSFALCKNLTSVTISDGVQWISDEAFSFCTGLTSIIIPASITYIGFAAFSYCSGLTSITVYWNTPLRNGGGELSFLNVNTANIRLIVPQGTKAIYEASRWNIFHIEESTIQSGTCGVNATWAFDSLTGKLIISGAGDMTDYEPDTNHRPWSSFATSITALVIENGVTGIGERAFGNYEGLASITIPESVTSIGEAAFAYCTGLTSVTVNWTTPLKIDSYVFEGISSTSARAASLAILRSASSITDLSNIRLLVPFGTKALYAAAAIWKDFRIEESGTGIDDIQTATLVRLEQSGDELYISHPSVTIDGVEVFDMNGRCVYRTTGATSQSISTSSWTKGIYVVVVRAGNSKTTHKLIKN